MKQNAALLVPACGWLLGMCAIVSLAVVPPVVLDPPAFMSVISNPDIRYKAQPAKAGKIDLTPNNGFFDRCFEAGDQQQAMPGDEGLISCSFGFLRRLSNGIPGTARWYLWCAEAGEIKATFFIQIPSGTTHRAWTVTAGDEKQTLTVQPDDGQSPQEQALTFAVKQSGKITFAIDCTTNPPAAETRIYSVRLEGSAITKASLLRTRWRPSAVHVHYYAPTNCPAPRMWVFETEDVGKTGSYSPLTTPFGYFGTSFKQGGVIPAGAGFNFSMWIAGREATHAPPIEKMARLIGTDIPDAEFSTFGGEGTGVKFRAGAYQHETPRTIQALRIEATPDGTRTYFGYFYDEAQKRWMLFASAQEPEKRKNMGGLLGSTGSFCEIPGPPDRERSGDLVREIKRRGWFLGSDQTWYRAQLGDGTSRVRKKDGDAPSISDERSYYMKDYASEGWMGMATGGMECYEIGSDSREMPAAHDGAKPAMPEYLSSEKTAQLFELPVRFGESRASAISSDHATIDCEIKKTGPNSKGILYYGTVDCLTYPPKNVSKGSAVEIDMYRPERTWQSATPAQTITTGTNTFKLAGLKGGTTYYLRLFVAHDAGKSWDYQSGRFTTAEPKRADGT